MAPVTQKLAGRVQCAKQVPRSKRASVRCSASARSDDASATRRQALSMLAGAVTLGAGTRQAVAEKAATYMPIEDATKVSKAVDEIYEARRDELSYKPRTDGATRFAYKKLSTDETKQRARESVARIEKKVPELVDKKYWQEAQDEIRRQVGTLRYDLNNLADDRGLPSERNKEFFRQLEELDYALRIKNQDRAKSSIEPLKSTLDSLLA